MYQEERQAIRIALAEWVGREILPHERDLRLWLRSRLFVADDVEDVVQECYCQLAQLKDVSHIENPRAYLFSMARNLVYRQRKRACVVRIEPLLDDTCSTLASDLPSPEREVAAIQELKRVREAFATLSERAQRIFVMRRIEGLSQRVIAERLGVTEAVVENDASRATRAILKLLTAPPSDEPSANVGNTHVRSR